MDREHPAVAGATGEQAHHAGRKQQPDQQRQAPVRSARRHGPEVTPPRLRRSLRAVFDHVTIRVSDREASERFYETVLGAIGIERTSHRRVG